MLTILIELALILVLARVVGAIFTKLGQPAVVGEILAGILLGPTILGAELSDTVFPADSRPLLLVLANLGLVLFMFVVGLELDLSLIKGRERVAASVSVASILVPFSSGILLAKYLSADHLPPGKDFWPFALFVGAAMSVTAFPVLARIMTDRGMHRTDTGGLALACAATDDILAWTLLAGVIAIGSADSGADGGSTAEHAEKLALGLPEPAGWVVALAVPFAMLLIFVVRPNLNRLTGAYQRAGRLTPGILSVVLLGILVSAATTDYLGVHFIFGAFLFGAILPHENAAALRHEILTRLEQISVLLLLPVFFLVSGLSVNLRELSAQDLVALLAILGVAIGGKYAGAYLGARSAGVPPWQANSLGILMNTRGLTELVILNVGKELGLIGDRLFSMLVVMAVVTTVMTGPLLARAYPKRRVARDIAEAERAAMGDAADRVLVVAVAGRGSEALVDVAIGLLHGRPHVEIVVAALEEQRARKLEMGSGLTDELAEMAAAMERQEALVHRAQARGVPVRVIANPSADLRADLLELSAAIAPQYVVAWADDELGQRVVDAAECPAVAVAAHLREVAAGSPVEIAYSADPHGEAAVVLGCRLAAAGAGAVDVVTGGGSTRKLDAARDALGQRGITLTPTPEGAFVVRVSAVGGPGDLQVRSELDASPVDWTHADLGVAATPAP